MNFVTVRVEMLVIGFQSLLWLILGTMGVLGYPQVEKFIITLSSSEVLVAVLALGVFYPIGILIDRIADYLLSIIKLQKLASYPPLKKCADNDKELNQARELISYSRPNLRIIRGSVVNSFLIIIAGIICASRPKIAQLPQYTSGFVITAGSIFLIVSTLLYAITQRVHELRVNALDAETKNCGNRSPNGRKGRKDVIC